MGHRETRERRPARDSGTSRLPGGRQSTCGSINMEAQISGRMWRMEDAAAPIGNEDPGVKKMLLDKEATESSFICNSETKKTNIISSFMCL